MRFRKGVPAGTTYPLSQEQIQGFPTSNLVSPRHAEDQLVHLHPKEIPSPTYPSDGDVFWSELVDVAWFVHLANEARDLTGRNVNIWSPLVAGDECTVDPLTSETIRQKLGIANASQAAELVRADLPTEIPLHLNKNLLAKDVGFRELFGIERKHEPFCRGIVLLEAAIAWVISQVSPTAFAAKWYFGRPRPEEVLAEWAHGRLAAPDWADHRLNQLVSNDQKNTNAFTRFPNGCPYHPSYPAMHASAAGAASLVAKVMFDTQERKSVRSEIENTALCTAHFRTLAGVHYPSDNVVGLALGEKVACKLLPEFLGNYGADLKAVQEACEEASCFWKFIEFGDTIDNPSEEKGPPS